MMKGQSQYDVSMEEIHHVQKLDHPSGTAITLANDVIGISGHKQQWSGVLEGKDEGKIEEKTLKIVSKRIGEVPGSHYIKWSSPIDQLEISHVAHSREGFAAGALSAAEWVIGKKGYFGMEDMLGF
jgi:4-hydroxy-tetrahydrodipicolinate reductase